MGNLYFEIWTLNFKPSFLSQNPSLSKPHLHTPSVVSHIPIWPPLNPFHPFTPKPSHKPPLHCFTTSAHYQKTHHPYHLFKAIYPATPTHKTNQIQPNPTTPRSPNPSQLPPLLFNPTWPKPNQPKSPSGHRCPIAILHHPTTT